MKSSHIFFFFCSPFIYSIYFVSIMHFIKFFTTRAKLPKMILRPWIFKCAANASDSQIKNILFFFFTRKKKFIGNEAASQPNKKRKKKVRKWFADYLSEGIFNNSQCLPIQFHECEPKKKKKKKNDKIVENFNQPTVNLFAQHFYKQTSLYVCSQTYTKFYDGIFLSAQYLYLENW